MRAESFLEELNARAREAGGLTVHVLAQATAEALEEIAAGASEPETENDPEHVPTPSTAHPDLEKLSVPELKELAADEGIEVRGTGADDQITKADLIQALS